MPDDLDVNARVVVSAVDDTGQVMSNLTNRVNQLSSQFQQMGTNSTRGFQQLNQQLQQLSQQTQQTNQAMTSFSGGLGGVIRGIADLTAKVVSVHELRRAFEEFARVERGLERVEFATRASGKQMQEYKQIIEESAAASGRSIEETQRSLITLVGSTNVSASTMAGLMGRLGEVAKVTGASFDSVARSAAAAMNNLHVPANQIADLMERWATIIPASMMESFGDIAPRMTQILEGIGFTGKKAGEELAAMWVQVARATGQPRLAFSEIQSLLERATTAGNRLGNIMIPTLQGIQQSGGGSLQLFEAMHNQLEQMGAFNPQVRPFLQQMFGIDFNTLKALQTIHEHLPDIRKDLAEGATEAEAFNKALSDMKDDPLSAIHAMTAEIHDLYVETGKLLQALGASQALHNMTQTFKDISKAIDELNKYLRGNPLDWDAWMNLTGLRQRIDHFKAYWAAIGQEIKDIGRGYIPGVGGFKGLSPEAQEAEKRERLYGGFVGGQSRSDEEMRLLRGPPRTEPETGEIRKGFGTETPFSKQFGAQYWGRELKYRERPKAEEEAPKTGEPQESPTARDEFWKGIPLPKMARGGITSGPTLAGEAGPELITPLRDTFAMREETKNTEDNTRATTANTKELERLNDYLSPKDRSVFATGAGGGAGGGGAGGGGGGGLGGFHGGGGGGPPGIDSSAAAPPDAALATSHAGPESGPEKLGQPGASGMFDPITGKLGGGVGDPRPGGRSHQGDDITAPGGSSVYAVKDGIVDHVGSDLYGRKAITIRHPDGTYTRYLHMDSITAPKAGDSVRGGQQIGTSGFKEPRRPGEKDINVAHLHFERWRGDPRRGGQIINPRREFGWNAQNQPRGAQMAGAGAGGRFALGDIQRSVTGVPESGTTTAAAGPTGVSGEGNEFLQQERGWIRDELRNDPQLARYLRGVVAHEQAPGFRGDVMESLANRLNYFRSHGQPNLTLRQYLARRGERQFYGPIRAGQINEAYLRRHADTPEGAATQREIDDVLMGRRERIAGMTDQGSRGDPNFGVGETIMRNREGYNEFGGRGGQHAAHEWRLRHNAAVAAAERTHREARAEDRREQHQDPGAGHYSLPGRAVPLQHGGIVTRPTHAMLGESGAEAVIPLNARAFIRGIGQTETGFDPREAVSEKYNLASSNVNVRKYGEKAADYGFFQMNRMDAEYAVKQLGMDPEMARHLHGGGGRGSSEAQQTAAVNEYIKRRWPGAYNNLVNKGDFEGMRKTAQGTWFGLHDKPKEALGEYERVRHAMEKPIRLSFDDQHVTRQYSSYRRRSARMENDWRSHAELGRARYASMLDIGQG